MRFFLGATGIASAHCGRHDVLHIRTNLAAACGRYSPVGNRTVLISTRIWQRRTLAEPVAPILNTFSIPGLRLSDVYARLIMPTWRRSLTRLTRDFAIIKRDG